MKMEIKIATIETKFDLLKNGNQVTSDNDSNFLKKHESEWKKVLKEVTEEAITKELKNSDKYGGVRISVDVTKFQTGSVIMTAIINAVFEHADIIANIIGIVSGLYALVKNKKPQLENNFKNALNEQCTFLAHNQQNIMVQNMNFYVNTVDTGNN
jgi:hypothetical protein